MNGDCSHEIKRCLLFGVLKSRDISLPTMLHTVKVFPRVFPILMSVWIWESDQKEGWMLKNWCFRIVVPEKTLESPLDSKEIKPVNPRGNKLWIFIGRTDAEVEALVHWPPDVKSQIIGKDPDAGKGWGQEEKRVTEDAVFGWYYWLSGHEFEQTLGCSGGQGSLVCCSPWGCKESDMT